MRKKNDKEFWKVRSEKYNELNWVKEPTYMDALIEMGRFSKKDLVLDVGTGTGVVAHAISPLVKEVIGLDKSQDMLEHSNWKENKFFVRRDILSPLFTDGVFDAITARMVFHHIMKNTQEAMDECYRMLKKGGRMILAEGVPPIKELKETYAKIFSLKEERLTFLEEDLVLLMKNAGFKKITVKRHIMKKFSVKNWLEKSGLPQGIQDKIFEMHVTGSDLFRSAYNMRIVNGDCLIDTKNLIVVGEK